MRGERFITAGILAAALGAPMAATAAEGDPDADFIAQQTAEGETTEFICENGFITVLFFDSGGTLVSSVESGTTCDPADFADGDVDGQAAGDNVDAALDQLFPGRNANSDLAGLFGIPVNVGFGAPGGAPPRQRDDAALNACFDRVAQIAAQLDAAEAKLAKIEGEIAGLKAGGPEVLKANFLDAATRNGEGDPERADVLARGANDAQRRLDVSIPGLVNLARNDPEKFQANIDAVRKQIAENQAAVNKNRRAARETQKQIVKKGKEVAAVIGGGGVVKEKGDTGLLGKTKVSGALGNISRGVKIGTAIAGFIVGAELDEDALELQAALVDDLKAIADNLEQIKNDVAKVDFRTQEIEANRQRDIANLIKKREGERKKAVAKVLRLRVVLDREDDRCEELQRTSAAPAPAIAVATRGGGLSLGTRLSDIRSQGRPQAGSAFGLGVLADDRLDVWVNTSLSFIDDGRDGLGQSGEAASLSLGASWRASPMFTFGGALRYGFSDTSGATGAAETEVLSLALFGQTKVGEIAVTGVGAVSFANTESLTTQNGAQATGDVSSTGFAVQVSASRSFPLGNGLSLTPGLSASYAHVDRDADVLSDGTAQPGAQTDSLSVSAGLGLGGSMTAEDGTVLSPSLGVSGFANLTQSRQFLTDDGSTVSSGSFGGSVGVGLGVQPAFGGSASFGAGISAVEGGQIAVSLSANLRLKF